MSAQPNPLDAVQFGPNDVASPTPVDASPDAVAGPQPDVAGGLQPDEVPNTQGDNPTAMAAPPKPSFWKNILHGALAGLEQGGGPGAVIGAIDPKLAIEAKERKLDVANSRKIFASAQAAHQVLQNEMDQHTMSMWPESLQMERAKIDAPVIEANSRMGIQPVGAVDIPRDANGRIDPGAFNKARVTLMKSLEQQYPNGIPASIHFLNTSDSLLAYDANAPGDLAKKMEQGNLVSAAMGQPPTSMETLQNRGITSNADRTKFLSAPLTFWNPVVKGSNGLAQKASAENLIGQYQGYLRLNSMLPDTDPRKAPAQKMLMDTIAHLQNQEAQATQAWHDQNAEKLKNDEKVADARYRELNKTKFMPKIGADGLIHNFLWDEQNGAYDIDQGIGATGSQGSRMSAAAASAAISNDAIQLITDNADKLGKLADYYQDKALDTPIADPKLSQIKTVLSSVAAMQAGVHQFRGLNVHDTFIKLIGSLYKNPDAIVSSLQALNMTAAAINPALRPGFNPNPGSPRHNAPPQNNANNLAGKTFSISKFMSDPRHKGANPAAVRAAALKAGMKVIP